MKIIHRIIEHLVCTGCLLNGIGTRNRVGSIEEVKENKKVVYYFAVFAIINELLIIRNHHISPAYWLM